MPGKAERVRSKFEGAVLADLRRRGVGYMYECKHYAYVRTPVYTPDIWLVGKGIDIEIKGYFRPADRSKMRAVRSANPDIDLRIVFQNPNVRLSKTSRTTYGEWATKFGFIWATGTIPEEWTRA